MILSSVTDAKPSLSLYTDSAVADNEAAVEATTESAAVLILSSLADARLSLSLKTDKDVADNEAAGAITESVAA